MILEKLKTKMLLTEYEIIQKHVKLKTAKKVSVLLEQIDFSAEVVPDEDPERLIKLLVSLKGKKLNSEEIKLVYEIANK